MFRLLAAVAAFSTAAMACGHTPASAAQHGSPARSSGEQIVEAYLKQLYGGDYAAALNSSTRLMAMANNAEGRSLAQAMRAAALLGLKRKAEATRAFAEADRLSSQAPAATILQFDAALLTDDPDMAAAALDRMIARFPDKVRELQLDAVFWVLRSENKAETTRNEDRRIALARLGFGGEASGDYTARDAIGILLKRGDVSGAGELLRHIDEPQVVEDMLIQRRFAPLWPMLEQHAGPRLEKVRASVVRVAEREYAEAPDNPQKLQLLANALRHAGRHSEAIALASKLPGDREAMSGADEEMGWAVNNVALALHEAGRRREADQLFARLNDAPMAQGRGRWRVSMIINRLELLVSDGEFAQAFKLLGAAEKSAADDGSPYARQLVRRLGYCTLTGLGRKEEAAKLFADMLKHAQDAYHATVDGLLCAGDIERAEELTLTAIEDEQFQKQLIRALQPQPLTSDDPSMWAARWRELRQRPRVAAAYARLGRDMPAALVVPSSRAGRGE